MARPQSQGGIIDLTGEEGSPEPKRARVDLAALAREREACRGAAPGHATSTPPPPPFFLLSSADEVGREPAHTTTFEKLTEGTWTWAILANFLICPAWLKSACPALMRCPLVVLADKRQVREAANDDLRSWAQKESHIHLIVPTITDPFGSHHSKFLLLFSRTGVRLIVHTANMLYHDARQMVQGVWTQDFPLRRAGPISPEEVGTMPQMGRVLHAYLRVCLPEAPDLGGEVGRVSAAHLLAIDFSSAGAHLLASVPGRHTGAAKERWGHPQLAQLLRREPAHLAPPGVSDPHRSEVCASDELVLQFSSLSSIGPNGKFWTELLASLSTQPASSRLPPSVLRANVPWPTQEEVRTSLLGYGGGVSMPAEESHANIPALKSALRHWCPAGHDPNLRSMTPHLKSYLRFDPVSKRVSWLALTSCNLSMAAWGTYDKERAQLYIKSFELGVLVTPTTLANASRYPRFDCQGQSVGGGSALDAPPAATAPAAIAMVPMGEAAELDKARALLDMGAAPLPLPYRLVPPAYGADERPWVTKHGKDDARFEQADRFGKTTSTARLFGRDKDGR